MKMYRLLIVFCAWCMIDGIANAKTTFLPDWMDSDLTTKKFDGNPNQDEDFCAESGLYHKATSCPAPKIFDEFCPYDDGWISDCYCPDIFANTCSAPYRGDERKTDGRTGYASCDDKWVACCDTTCPGNTSLTDPGGCGGSTVNACGDTCYYPYEPCCEPLADETNCKYGEEICSDGCDGTRTCCKACEPLVDVDVSTCEYGTVSCDDGCGGTRQCCGTCTPLSSVKSEDCDWGTKSCSDGCDGTRTCCKSCEDNGGSSSCTGQTSKCGENQTEVSSCMNCSGTKLYTCEDNNSPEECTIPCIVGNIYYSDGTCSADVLSDKTAIGVVVKDYELIIATSLKNTGWGEFGTVVSGVSETIVTNTAKTDYAGRSNTAAIMAHYNGNSSATTFAAVHCYNYTTAETSKGQWYLPSAGEVYYYLYKNYAKVKAAWDKLGVSVPNSLFWSSTEYDNYGAWYINSANGTLDFYSKYNVSGNYRTAGCFAPIGGCFEVCSAEYKNVCTGVGYDKGIGDACGGYYKSCECSEGYVWNGSICVANCIEGGDPSDTSCVVGNIYYSDGTCSACIVSGKTPVGVVTKDNELVMNKAILMKWADDSVDLSSLSNLDSNSAKTDMKGKANTKAIVNHYGENISGVAGVYCYNYAPSGMESSKNKWYLPAAGELYNYLSPNYTKLNNAYTKLEWQYLSKSASSNMYSSSEKSATSVWVMHPQLTDVSSAAKSNNIGVVCYLPIGENADNNGDEDDCVDGGDENCTGSTSCTYGYSSSCKTCSGTTLYVCNECADGGSKTCTGQATKCGENQTEVSSCMNCSGTKLYTCEDKPAEATCSGNSECVVGAIYYTDGTCCSELISLKSVAGVVVKDYKLVMWSKQLSSKWSSKKEDLSVLTNYSSSVPDYQAKSDYFGSSNTAAIVEYYGSSATDNAAVVCYNYAPEGMEASKTKWYMPATGELYEYVHTNYPILASTYIDLLGWSKFDSSFWSSTEKSSSYAWEVYSAGDSLYDYDKTYSQSLGCFLAINASAASKTCQTSSCVVGSIYYSDKTCSSCLISSKTPVGIVVKDNDLVVALNIAQMEWTGRTSVSGITNDTYASEAKTRYNGKENTTKIVTQYGANATEYAGVYCYNYAPNGMSSSKGSWYLPDVGELNDYLYANYAKVKKGWNQTNTKVPHSDFWSSAQRYAGDAWYVNVVSGNINYVAKSYDYSVGCFLKI